jgi:hypothetical protein
MKPAKSTPIIRWFAATLVSASIITLSALAMNAPTQTQSPVTLKRIQTDRTATLYAGQRPGCAWFVEAVYADKRPSCAWFVEAVLPTADSVQATETLKSVSATL